jgi:hypothetical protein
MPACLKPPLGRPRNRACALACRTRRRRMCAAVGCSVGPSRFSGRVAEWVAHWAVGPAQDHAMMLLCADSEEETAVVDDLVSLSRLVCGPGHAQLVSP